MGGSTRVELNIRMPVWLETVPALLKKVNVEHVSIVTHSAGGVYTLNTLAKHRSILDPKAPYVALLGTLNNDLTS
jgi:pimeloyl-ACP methyl ester carboxylesterase